MNASLTRASHRTLNTQNDAPKVEELVGERLLFGPPPLGEGRRGRQPASSRPSSAAISPNRLMAIIPSALWPDARHIAQPQDPPRHTWRSCVSRPRRRPAEVRRGRLACCTTLATKFSTTSKDRHQDHGVKRQATTQNVVVKILDEMGSE